MFLYWPIWQNHPSKPGECKMEVKELTNYTSLSWEKPKSGVK